jgi:hypothetical protein
VGRWVGRYVGRYVGILLQPIELNIAIVEIIIN